MAQTRATSKALRGPLGFIVHLAGFSATPAEEMPSDVAAPQHYGDATKPIGGKRKVSESEASVPMVTQKQHDHIGALVGDIAKASKQPVDKVADDSRAWCKERFGVQSRKELTSAQASELITYLKGILELAEASDRVMGFHWIWGPTAWGLEIEYRPQRGVFVGWRSPYWKKRGW